MIDSFVKKHGMLLRRAISLGAVGVMAVVTLSGCFGLDKTDPSANQDTGTLPNLIDESTTPSSESVPDTSEPETTPSESSDTATVVSQVNVLSSASTTRGVVVGVLQQGEQVTVDRTEVIYGISWSLIAKDSIHGWVQSENLDMSNVSGADTPSTDTPAGEGNTDTTEPKPDTTGGTTTPTGTKKGVVTASELNIRDKAGKDGERVGQYVYGDRVVITETSNGWGKTDKGWISMDYVYQDGTTGSNPCKGIVTGTALNVRTGPGTNYDKAAGLSQGDRVNVLERIKIGTTTWGCTKDGWISMDYVYVDGTTGDGSGTGTVTGDVLNIRSGPGTNYDKVGSLSSGTSIKIYAQFTLGDMTWGCTDKGWVSMTYVEMD